MTLQYQLWKLGLILHLLLVYDFGQLTSSLALCHGLIPLLGYTPRQKSRKDKRVLSRSSCRLLAIEEYALPLSYAHAQPSSRSIMSMRRSTWYQVLYAYTKTVPGSVIDTLLYVIPAPFISIKWPASSSRVEMFLLTMLLFERYSSQCALHFIVKVTGTQCGM